MENTIFSNSDVCVTLCVQNLGKVWEIVDTLDEENQELFYSLLDDAERIENGKEAIYFWDIGCIFSFTEKKEIFFSVLNKLDIEEYHLLALNLSTGMNEEYGCYIQNNSFKPEIKHYICYVNKDRILTIPRNIETRQKCDVTFAFLDKTKKKLDKRKKKLDKREQELNEREQELNEKNIKSCQLFEKAYKIQRGNFYDAFILLMVVLIFSITFILLRC